MPPAKRRPRSDLEEIAPNRFIMHNARVQTLLKTEGEINGRLFTLTTWRRDGLIARLRARTFVVDTLADQIEALPLPPEPLETGEARWRALGSPTERFSLFDAQQLRWQPLEAEERNGVTGIVMQSGDVLRRRKGRGPASFYLAVSEHNGLALRPLNETQALLEGYAQASEHRLTLAAQRQGEQIRLPDVELPAPYRALLRRIASAKGDALVVDQQGWAFAQELFARLGVRIEL